MSTSTSATHDPATTRGVAGVDAAERTAAAFGVATAVTVLFNTLLAWIKDAWEPLNNFMAALTGHHWWTHGLFDLAVFVVVGWLLASRSGELRLGDGIVRGLAVSVVIAGLGLAGWFLVV